jgi:transcriptional regulator with XRE-family HTH domain
MRKHSVGDVTYFGEFADTYINVSDEDWAYYNFSDSLSDQVAEYMDTRGITKTALAERLGTSKAFVSKILAGDANLTMKTISRILYHIGAKPEIKVVEKDTQVKWFGLISQKDRNSCSTVQSKPPTGVAPRESSRVGATTELLTAA